MSIISIFLLIVLLILLAINISILAINLNAKIKSGGSIPCTNLFSIEQEIFSEETDDEGNTILMRNIASNNYQKCILFINKFAEKSILDKQNNDGNTALIIAAKNNYADIAKLLIEKGANLNIQNKNGNTALISAVLNKNNEMVTLLVKNGANLDIQDKYGFTALMLVMNRKIDMAKLLIESGANVNIQNKIGNTALMIASFYNNIEIVQLLLDNGADVNIEDINGYTAAIQLARNYNTYNHKIIRLLSKYGARMW